MLKKSSLILLFGLLLGGSTAGTACIAYSCKAFFYGFRINSFDQCAAAGFPVIAGDPARCYLTEEKVFLQPPQHVKISSPQPNERVGNRFLLSGEARAVGNQVEFVLTGAQNTVIAEGRIPVASEDLGRRGRFSQQIILDAAKSGNASLEVFERMPSGEKESVVMVPVLLAAAEEAVADTPRAGTNLPILTPAAASQSPGPVFDPLSDAPVDLPRSAQLKVPFTPQAPFADWNPPYDEACEEASLLMTKYYLSGDELPLAQASNEIVLLTEWQQKHGYAVDINTTDTATVAQQHFDLKSRVYTGAEVTIDNIKRLIAAGHPVIIPAAGKLLKNPYFRGAGPPYHMLVIIGYDGSRFIANDPGTKRGAGFAYDQQLLFNAIHDWTGNKNTVTQGQKAMLVLSES